VGVGVRPLDPASGLPLYLQVARSLQEDIAAGSHAEGDAVPSLRDTAAALRVNVHTVAKAYQLLERDGVLERQRGDTYRVAAAAQAAAELLAADIDQLIDRAAGMGVSAEALVEMIERAVERRAVRRA
jgi:GntR family transcriptional regulator